MKALNRIVRAALSVAGVIAIFYSFQLVGCIASAHADPTAVSPPPAPGWSMAEVMALIALIVAGIHALVEGARAFLHFTAPRTASTWDDRAAATLDAVHQRLAAVEALIPTKVAVVSSGPPASTASGIIGPIAVLALLLGGLLAVPACATVKTDAAAAKVAVVECAKQDAAPILSALAQFGAQAALSALTGGSIDWSGIEAAALVQGKVVGGCALTRFVAELAKAPKTTARALIAGPDPAADGQAAIARLSTRFAGATWQ